MEHEKGITLENAFVSITDVFPESPIPVNKRWDFIRAHAPDVYPNYFYHRRVHDFYQKAERYAKSPLSIYIAAESAWLQFHFQKMLWLNKIGKAHISYWMSEVALYHAMRMYEMLSITITNGELTGIEFNQDFKGKFLWIN